MNIRVELKKLAEHVPRPLGELLSHVPFSWRLGATYSRTVADIARFAQLDNASLKNEIATRVNNILRSAKKNCRFYREYYAASADVSCQVANFDDIRELPVVTKGALSTRSIEDRTALQAGAIRANTGGSSGEPLSFYLDRNAFGREWAHMHFIWSQLGYRPTDLKLTFRGRNLGDAPVRYNAVHNEYMVNPYCAQSRQLEAVSRVASRIKFIHGYPSSIYEFVMSATEHAPELLATLRKGLKGVLLGSEYPAPVFRDAIESALETKTLSWYGHSEMAVLAYEVEPYVYKPMQSYGYCEAVKSEHGNHHLVGTAYHNSVHPFIRYDTGDIIDPTIEDGLLTSFKISEGRVGEFIQDKTGNRISLTALIFGRHHGIFDKARFVQVRVLAQGRVRVLITAGPESGLSQSNMSDEFDFTNVNIECEFEIRSEPVRTAAGKVPLLVS